jgi:hypothetical protein
MKEEVPDWEFYCPSKKTNTLLLTTSIEAKKATTMLQGTVVAVIR